MQKAADQQIVNSFRLAFPNFNVIDWRTLGSIEAGLSRIPNADVKRSLMRSCIAFADINFISVMARSKSSILYCAKLRNVEVVAVRSFAAMASLSSDSISDVIARLGTFSTLFHPHILSFYGHCWSPVPCVVIEYMEGGDMSTLMERIISSRRQISSYSWNTFALHIFMQISDALMYLHERDVSYSFVYLRDILVYSKYGSKGAVEFKQLIYPCFFEHINAANILIGLARHSAQIAPIRSQRSYSHLDFVCGKYTLASDFREISECSIFRLPSEIRTPCMPCFDYVVPC